MKNEIRSEITKVENIFGKKMKITRYGELILEPKNNIFFRLGDIETVLDFKCKFIAWLSRPSCKGLNKYWQSKIRFWFNEYLGTSFTQEEISEHIYTLLGNDVNRKLCERFVESNYDLEILISYEAGK